MNYYEGIYSHGSKVMAEMRRSERRSHYWYPLKRYFDRMFKVGMFLTTVASFALSSVMVVGMFIN